MLPMPWHSIAAAPYPRGSAAVDATHSTADATKPPLLRPHRHRFVMRAPQGKT
ncbi:hypothetical protein BDA96_10G146600 [Sorghum bicolor]|uniref:Uncharacterized protein n=1 Tax=Sorghum bicolor TaxID=4558 RepID=A0A921Q401_SORBI|nr:hypothetical protein BDA96_10G146600 [Sorghum bicolor]